MRWPIFLFMALVFLVLDSSFMGILTIHGMRGIAPHMVFTLIVFVCLFATRASALWACLLLGVLMDLTLPPRGNPAGAAGMSQAVHLIGPHALGAVFAGYLVLQMRTMVFRQRALTIGALTFIATLAAGILAITIFLIRSWYGEPFPGRASGGSAAGELLRQMGIAIYSGLVALPLGWMLLRTMPVWGFQSVLTRRSVNVR